MYGSQWGSLAAACSLQKAYFYCKSCDNLYQYYKSGENQYQVLQVTCTVSECAVKLKIKIIITIVPSYSGKNITCLLLLVLLLRTVHL